MNTVLLRLLEVGHLDLQVLVDVDEAIYPSFQAADFFAALLPRVGLVLGLLGGIGGVDRLLEGVDVGMPLCPLRHQVVLPAIMHQLVPASVTSHHAIC